MDWLAAFFDGYQTWERLSMAGVGLIAGLGGGLLGIGGSTINVPAIVLLLGRGVHLAQAASMVGAIFVAVFAARGHRKANAVRRSVVRRLLPASLVGVAAGVIISLYTPQVVMEKLFGGYMVLVFIDNVRRLYIGAAMKLLPEDGPEPTPSWLTGSAAGGVAGTLVGLLGIGGGTITVPMNQLLCKLRLRQAIATSAAIMCWTAPLCALLKCATLSEVTGSAPDLHWYTPLPIAVCLIPTALIGAHVGARLTHRLAVRHVRVIFMVFVAAAAVEMLR